MLDFQEEIESKYGLSPWNIKHNMREDWQEQEQMFSEFVVNHFNDQYMHHPLKLNSSAMKSINTNSQQEIKLNKKLKTFRKNNKSLGKYNAQTHRQITNRSQNKHFNAKIQTKDKSKSKFRGNKNQRIKSHRNAVKQSSNGIKINLKLLNSSKTSIQSIKKTMISSLNEINSSQQRILDNEQKFPEFLELKKQYTKQENEKSKILINKNLIKTAPVIDIKQINQERQQNQSLTGKPINQKNIINNQLFNEKYTTNCSLELLSNRSSLNSYVNQNYIKQNSPVLVEKQFTNGINTCDTNINKVLLTPYTAQNSKNKMLHIMQKQNRFKIGKEDKKLVNNKIVRNNPVVVRPETSKIKYCNYNKINSILSCEKNINNCNEEYFFLVTNFQNTKSNKKYKKINDGGKIKGNTPRF